MHWIDRYFSPSVRRQLNSSAASIRGLRKRLRKSRVAPVLAQTEDAAALTSLALASWLEHRPFAIAPPGQSASDCARAIGATQVFTDADSDTVEAEADDFSGGETWWEDECAGIIFSSGSTGAPKGVRHSLQNLFGSARLFLDHFGIEPGDRVNCLAAPHVMSGYRALLLPLVADLRVEFLHAAKESGLGLVMRALAGDWVICGPHFVRLVAASAAWLKDERMPRALLVTGDHLDHETRETVVQELGLPVVNYYGLTETGGIVMAEDPAQTRSQLLPPACATVRLRTREVSGSPMFRELGIEGPNNFLGYCGDPIAKQRIVWTGDLVDEVESGRFRLVGRLDGAIKAPDTTWLFPDRLEQWLRSQADISDAVVRPVAEASKLECWIDWNGEEGVLRTRIEDELGRAYQPQAFHASTIARSALGKLQRLKTHDGREFLP